MSCGDGGIDNKGVSLDFNGVELVHLSCLLDLKYVFTFGGTYRVIEIKSKSKVGLSVQNI